MIAWTRVRFTVMRSRFLASNRPMGSTWSCALMLHVMAVAASFCINEFSLAQCQVQLLTQPNGFAVHLDGDVAALSRWEGTVNRNHKVFVYRRYGLELIEEAVLTTPPGYESVLYGGATAVNGDWIAVSDYQVNVGVGGGRVYMYRLIDGAWTFVQELAPLSGLFGKSIDMQGERMIIGAPQWWGGTVENPIYAVGRAYVYRLDDDAWVLEAELPNPDPQEWHNYGWSVAIAGDRAVIGANTAYNNAGRAYLYERVEGEWVFTRGFVPELPGAFGRAVAVAEDVVAVGAWASPSWTHGRVYIYGPGDQVRIISGIDLPLIPPPGTGSARLGWAMDIDATGTRLLAGAIEENGGGAAFLLRRDENDDWVFQKKFSGSSNYGGALALAGDFAIVAAINSPGTGKVHLYAGILGEDCNDSGEPDACDIFTGDSKDINANLIPDECEVAGDLNNDGVVDVFDLLELLSAWGFCANCEFIACPADLDGDCFVDVFDLLILLGNWS
jgi:hypothetical protein